MLMVALLVYRAHNISRRNYNVLNSNELKALVASKVLIFRNCSSIFHHVSLSAMPFILDENLEYQFLHVDEGGILSDVLVESTTQE